MDTRTPALDTLERRLDAELRLVHEAILMVAGHRSPRVLVAGLRLGAEILEPARALAAASGVRVIPEWTADEGSLAIRVEAISP